MCFNLSSEKSLKMEEKNHIIELKQVEIKIIGFKETFNLRHSVMNPEKIIDQMYRPGDESALHIGAFINKHLNGITSFFEEDPKIWRIRGMAVDPLYQKLGIGRKLVKFGFDHIEDPELIWCNSRISAIDFYKKLGFDQTSEEFELAGHGK